MKFGVNYTPRAHWFHHWVDFDASEVARDFDTIAELGADHMRVFPLWPVFQPNPSFVSPTALGHLDTLLSLAAERGLGVSLDGLQGHLSSYDFLPSWMLSWHDRNMFTDQYAIDSTALFVRELAKVASAHDNVFAFTLGNEINQFTGGVHPFPHPATTSDIDAWFDAMFAAVGEGAPGLSQNHACYDAAWYDDTQPFTLEHVAQRGDLSIVHSWVFNGTAQKYGPDAFETRAHARYMMEIARAFHVDPKRQIWAQELGTPRNVLPKESVPGFIESTVEQVLSAPEVFGITWWCSHDVSRSLADYPELEYDLGLIDEHGNIKPEGRMVAEAVKEYSGKVISPTRDIELDLDALGGRRALAPGGAFFTRYMEEAREHGHPRIVLPGRSGY